MTRPTMGATAVSSKKAAFSSAFATTIASPKVAALHHTLPFRPIATSNGISGCERLQYRRVALQQQFGELWRHDGDQRLA